MGHSKKSPACRYLAKRTLLKTQQTLLGVEQNDEDLPFPTMSLEEKRCKVFGIVTNMDWNGERLIHWHHERCGKSEEAHAVMKGDLAGGKLLSGNFGTNAAWWSVCYIGGGFWLGKGLSLYKKRVMTCGIPVAEGCLALPSFRYSIRDSRQNAEVWGKAIFFQPILRIPGRIIKKVERQRRFE